MKVAIYVRGDELSIKIAEKIKKKLTLNEITIDNENPNVVIFVGGDGTLLRAIHLYIDKIDQIHFIGVRTGTLGFFCDYKPSEIDEVINRLKNGANSKKYRLIEAEIATNTSKKKIFAVNEIRIENPFHTLITNIYIDDFLTNAFYGNGLNVSSQLGSSAYNRSLGGALVERGLEILQLQEIAALSNRSYRSINSPLILDPKHVIKFAPVAKKTIIGYDHLTLEMDEDYTISIWLSDKTFQLIHHENNTYFDVLNSTFMKDKVEDKK